MDSDYTQIFITQELFTSGTSNLKACVNKLLPLSYTTLFICKEGRAVVSVNFKNYLLQPSDILVLAEDSVVRVLRVSDDFSLQYYLMNRSFAAEIAYNLPNSLFLYLNEYPLARPAECDIALLQMWIEQARHILEYCSIYRHVMMRNHLQNIFLKIAEEMPAEGTFAQRQRSRREMLCWSFWEMIGRYCTMQRKVSFYAKELNITPFYLSQLTKEYLNDSPKDLIDRQVVLELKALLTSTQLSIKEIAEQLNFEDTSYMARYFRRHTGMTLTEYRG